jgi:hypothetical protein
MTATDPTPQPGEFHEPDERPDDVAAAFDRGERGVTAPPPPTVQASGVTLDEPTGERTAGTPVVTHASGPGQGMPLVAGYCPACRGSSLFLGVGGHATCARLDCPDPSAADDLLHGGPADPVVVLEDALCRRVWAAALRWEADQLRNAAPRWEAASPQTAESSRYYASVLEIDAHRIETGELTPWADQPEPGRGCPADAFLADPPERQLAEWERELAVSQSVPAGDATAAAGPTPGQADLASGGDAQSEPAVSLASAPAGPAILGRALLGARVWREDLAPGTGLWSCGDGNWFRREVVEDGERGLVREVLLVSLAGGEVIERAWRWLHALDAPDSEDLLVDAVRALGEPDEPATVYAGPVSPGDLAAVAHASGGGFRSVAVDFEPAPDDQYRCPVTHPAHGQCELHQGHRPDDTDPDRRHRTGALLWLTDAEIRACALPPLASYAGTADLQSGPANASGPAGGSGWDRKTIVALAAGLAGEVLDAELISPERGRELGAEVLALLASYDDAAEDTRRECDRAGMETAEVRVELGRLAGDVADRDATITHLRAELDSHRAASGPLAVHLATARRDASADTLEWAARELDDPGATAIDHLFAAKVAAWAAEVRAGARPVPGSPEPAPAGGEEPRDA